MAMVDTELLQLLSSACTERSLFTNPSQLLLLTVDTEAMVATEVVTLPQASPSALPTAAMLDQALHHALRDPPDMVDTPATLTGRPLLPPLANLTTGAPTSHATDGEQQD